MLYKSNKKIELEHSENAMLESSGILSTVGKRLETLIFVPWIYIGRRRAWDDGLVPIFTNVKRGIVAEGPNFILVIQF